MNYKSIKKLIELYNNISKHSHYQMLAPGLCNYIDQNNIDVKSRYEKERLDYILKNLPVSHRNIVDIGSNTGFFSFELLRHGADKAILYEGNPFHSEFAEVAASVLGYESRITVNNEYYQFDQYFPTSRSDIVLLLNVLHHVGDDFGNKNTTENSALDLMADCIRALATVTRHLVLQVGYNWKGNPNLPLFNNGTKAEAIEFVRESALNYWKIEHIGIPVLVDDQVQYAELNSDNVVRNNSLGEFLNRPLFIMSSLL